MRKHYLSLCIIAGLLLGSSTTQAGAPLWNNIAPQSIPSTLKQNVYPITYQAFKLDIANLKATLQSAGSTYNTGVRIQLPLGDQIQNLVVWKDAVMAPELQAKFPEIVSFLAVDPDNHSISGRIDLNSYGFHSMIVNPEFGTYMIDPFSLYSTDYYVGYFRKDIDKNVYNSGVCGVNDEMQELLKPTERIDISTSGDPSIGTPSSGLRPHGSMRRIYRCAISCTGEWANMITDGAPSVGGVLGIISTVISRANVVFQRELSVKMELIPTNNEIIHINPDTDPYTCPGESHDCLIDQVQAHLDAEYPGGVGYDIGHIFCTAGGGLAQLQAVCATTGKGKGVSGVYTDSDIGTVIHEMGHQMGAPHTFNSKLGGCSGNGMGESAYEPGSGTSIMSYNGSCDEDNVGAPSSDYYHVSTLKMITDYIVFGGGNACAETELGYTPITIIPLGQTYTIPKNTPFELISETPTTSEPAPPVILYSWEQHDLGHFEEEESGSSDWDSGPIFESRSPVPFRNYREFPDNSLVIDGDYSTVGQRLPKKPREMNFKLTHRSFFEGWGTFNYSDDMIKLKVDSNSNPFRVNKPNTTLLYEVGSPIEITWDTVRTRIAPMSVGFVNVFMSIDGGNTFPFLVAANVPNTGGYNLSAPDIYSDNIYFKVKASGNVFYDISKTPVKIHGALVGIDDLDIFSSIRIFPNPTEGILNINSDHILQDEMSVIMYDITGKQIYQNEFKHNLQIDLSAFSRGTYLLYIVDSKSGKSKTDKIVLK